MKKITAGSYANRRIEMQMRDSKLGTLAKWTIVSETTCYHGVRFAECVISELIVNLLTLVILSGKALEGKQLTFSFDSFRVHRRSKYTS